jgi:hypothetical protein
VSAARRTLGRGFFVSQVAAGTYSVLSTSWLASTTLDEGAPRMAVYQNGLLVGWQAGSTSTFLETLNAAGAATSAPTPVSLPFGSAFVSYANGDAGWVYPQMTSLNLVRVVSCH